MRKSKATKNLAGKSENKPSTKPHLDQILTDVVQILAKEKWRPSLGGKMKPALQDPEPMLD